jgi:streptomycin 6-kinase
VIVPASLEQSCEGIPERTDWLARLPALVREAAARWRLVVGEPFDHEDASCGWVAPVTREGGAPAVLKVGMPHFEGAHEIRGLRLWNGDGMARLLEADEPLGAMLLERCVPGTPLRDRPEPEQDAVLAGLLRRLWRIPAAPDGFRPLAALTARWSEETIGYEARWPDAGLVRAGLALFETLPRGAPREALLVTDLHAGNVLRAEREPWLAIDPKPFVGDPAFDATQHLFNCLGRMAEDPFGTIARFAELLGVEAERVRLWTFARAAAEPREGWTACRRFELARRLRP